MSGADHLAETAHHARILVETAVGGIKLALDEYVVPVADSAGLDDFMIDGSNFTSYLQQLESTAARCDDRIRVDLASTPEWPALGLRAAAPVLRLERQAFSRTDRPLFLCNRCILPSATTQYQVVIE